LPVSRQDVGKRYAVDEANDDVPNQRGTKDLVGEPLCNGEKEEEGYERQDADDCDAV
jgi:hypothetical protein